MSEFNRLRAAILALDIALTGQERMARHNDRQRTDETLRDFAMDMGNSLVYLADGGYSRVFVHFDGHDMPTLHLASESTSKVAQMFNRCIEQRREVEMAIESLWESWLADPQSAGC